MRRPGRNKYEPGSTRHEERRAVEPQKPLIEHSAQQSAASSRTCRQRAALESGWGVTRVQPGLKLRPSVENVSGESLAARVLGVWLSAEVRSERTWSFQFLVGNLKVSSEY